MRFCVPPSLGVAVRRVLPISSATLADFSKGAPISK
jgi:hypothetical protein